MELIVFVHGLGQLPQTWQDQVTDMPPARFKAVAPWVQGLRPGRLGTFSPEGAADDLLGLLNPNGVESMIVVGSGLGAVVGMTAAQRAPECVSALVVEGLSLSFGRMAMTAQRTLIKAMPSARWAATGLDRPTVLSVLDGLAGVDLAPGLSTVSARTLVLCGDADRGLRAPAEATAAGIPDARLEVLAGASDPLHLSNPAAFNRALWDLLDAD